MRKGIVTGVALLMAVPGLLTTASCGKKQVLPQETMVTTSQDETGAARSADEDQQLWAEEAIQQEEAARQEALRKAQMAEEAFTGDDVYFEYDSALLTAQAQALLMVKAKWMQTNPKSRVLIQGHCDERGSNEYNLALGDRRAASVKTFLVNLGLSAYRISTVSYGEEKPVDTGKTESAYAKNRRAHFILK